MFESKLNRYLKKRLGVLLKNDTIIDDKLLLKLYCTFWLNDGNESDFGANVWIDLDVAHEDYFSLSQEVLTMEFFEYIRFVLGSYIFDIDTVENLIGSNDDYAWTALQIFTIKDCTLDKKGRLNKAVEKDLFEQYTIGISSYQIEPIEKNEFLTLYFAINTFSLDQNWLARNENKLNKDAEEAVSIFNNVLLVSKEKQYEDCNSLYGKVPVTSIAESFTGSRFCSLKTDEEIAKAYMKITNGLMRARNPLDVLCTIYLGKRTLNNTSFIFPNDVTLENSIVYHFFTSYINPRSIADDYIVFAPSPFFVRKMASDDVLRNIPITFVVADDNIRDIFIRHFNEIRYSGGKGNYFTFLSFDDYFKETVKEEGNAFNYSLIFANNIRDNTLKQLNAVLRRYQQTEQTVMVLSSDKYLQSFMAADIGRHSLEEIVLVAEGIHNSTEPKRKVFWKYGANSCNDIKITKMAFINTRNKIQRMMPVENGNKVLSKDALMDADYDVRTAYKGLMLGIDENDVAERNKPRCVRFSEEINFWYSLARNLDYPGQVRVEAYACEAMPEGKEARGFMARGKRISGSVKRYTRVAESEVEKWIINDYPYAGLGKSRNHVSFEVRNAISEYYKGYYAAKGALCDISLRTLCYIYFDDIAQRLSDKEQLILSEMTRGPIGELNTEYSTFGDYVYALQEMHPYLTNTQLEGRLSLLFEALEVAVSNNHASKNALEELIEEESNARKKYLQVTNALVKNTFTRSEFEKIYQHICWHLNRGNSEYLGLLIKLFTGVETEMVCALKWSDYVNISDGNDIRALSITKEVSSDGSVVKPVSRVTEYRTIPCCDILRNYLDRYLKQTADESPSDYMERNIVTIRNSDSVVAPKDMYQLSKTLIEKLGIEEVAIEIPYGKGRMRTRNLNKYGGDVFKSNLRHWAADVGGFTKDELAYIAGNVKATTLGKHYELHDDESSLETYYVKLNRIGSMLLGEKKTASEYKNVFGDKNESIFCALGEFPAEINMTFEVEEDTLVTFASEYGLTLQVIELE